MARQHDLDEELLRHAVTASATMSADVDQAQTQAAPAALPGLTGAGVEDRARMMAALQHGAGNQAVQRSFAADGRVGAEGGELDPALAAKLEGGRAGGQPIDPSVRTVLETNLGTDLDSVRIHTDTTADSLSRQLSSKAFTSGNDIFFRRGAYDPSSAAGRDLLGHEVAHVVQQAGQPTSGPLTVAPAHTEHEAAADAAARTVEHGRTASAGPALSGALIARRTDADELEAAAAQAEKEDALSAAASSITNVADLAAAKAAKAKVADGSLSLAAGRAGTMAGAEVTPDHEAANAQIIQSLDFYIGFSGEETRTGVDFIDRYKHAHAAFARLEAMAVQYEQMTGQSAMKSTDLLSAETGATSGDDAKAKFGGLTGAETPAMAAVVAARTGLTQTESAMQALKDAIDPSATAARAGFREVVTATHEMAKAAEENTVKEKSAEVAKVKADIAQLQSWISSGIDIASALGTAGVTAGAAVAARGAGAAVSAGADAAVLKGKDLAFDKAKATGKEAVSGFSEFVATKTYELELERAQTGLVIAGKLGSGYAAEIGGNRIRTAIDLWQQSLRTLRDKSAEFDRLQQVMQTQIRQVGEAMEAAGMGKQEGARFTVVAEFRGEATAFVNEADVALTLGRQHRDAVDEAGKRRGAAAYNDQDTSRVWYDAYRGHDGRFRLRMNHLNLGIRIAAGEGGSIETVDLLLKELQAYRATAERYRSDLAKAMGGTA